MALALEAAERLGVTCLLLNCRGADRLGTDIYHSGLSQDISEALSSPALKDAKAIDLFGYSIGGHIALRYVTREVDSRVRRVAAIGSPLDLHAAADDFDGAPFNVYRGHVLDALKEIYTAAYQRRPRGIEPVVARKIDKIRDWDELIVAPRFGFGSGPDYYASESVSTRLAQLKRDALYIGAVCDPMVQMKSVLPFVDAPRLKVVWDERAGHLGFPADFDIEMAGPLGVESQVFAWFAEG
jgi:predicted alpha/beta-fold hydrolase